MQAKLRKAALDAGVTLIAPETVFLAADTTFGKDVTIEPFVVIGPGVCIADGAVIHSFSHIVQASIGKKASGRPLCAVAARDRRSATARKIGNFVEVKASTLEAGAKVNHLTYIGDTHVGAERQYRRRHHHLQLRRLLQAPDRRSARAPSSAPIPRWSRR